MGRAGLLKKKKTVSGADLELQCEQCAEVQIYSTVRAQSRVQRERENKAGSIAVRGAVEPRRATPFQSAQANQRGG